MLSSNQVSIDGNLLTTQATLNLFDKTQVQLWVDQGKRCSTYKIQGNELNEIIHFTGGFKETQLDFYVVYEIYQNLNILLAYLFKT